jgi:site-specific DNA-methyltransferase (adenine-specific)
MTGLNILQGDCLDVMPTLDDRSVDSIITDPPYGLSFMGKDWDHGVPGVHFWVEALRVAKPGAYLLAFGGTRTFHRLTVAIEDAGWEIRDCIGWLYGSGFPKSLDVGKAIDKLQGNEREMLGAKPYTTQDIRGNAFESDVAKNRPRLQEYFTKGHSEREGFGTALKPAWEPVIVARKPIVGTVANNVLKYGTGAMNIDGCRIPTEEDQRRPSAGGDNGLIGTSTFKIHERKTEDQIKHQGRWPANIIHDGSEEVLAVFPDTKQTRPHDGDGGKLDTRNQGWGFKRMPCSLSDNGGSAARFFYCAKASKQDRDEGCDELPLSDCGMMEDDNYPIKTGSGNLRETKRRNNHPTVKPTSLMRYLCKLVTPPGGTILDPFMGSGSTGKAASLEGFRFIGIELEGDYIEIAGRRIGAVQPLFAGASL